MSQDFYQNKHFYFNSLPAGKAFLEQQICALKNKLALDPKSAFLHATLASYHDLLKDTSSALRHLNTAVELDSFDKNIAWLHLKVKRGKDLEDNQSLLQDHVLKHSPLEFKLPNPVEVSQKLMAVH